jgi:magnesium transporter
MKYLTAVTILLAVPTLVASIYGMNLTTLPFMAHPHSFAIVMGFSGVLGFIIAAVFYILSKKSKF